MKYYKHYIVDNHKIKEAALLRQPLFLFSEYDAVYLKAFSSSPSPLSFSLSK